MKTIKRKYFRDFLYFVSSVHYKSIIQWNNSLGVTWGHVLWLG